MEILESSSSLKTSPGLPPCHKWASKEEDKKQVSWEYQHKGKAADPWCHHTGWSRNRPDAATGNRKYFWRILDYRFCPFYPEEARISEESASGLGHISRRLPEETWARQERLWSKAKGYASNTDPSHWKGFLCVDDNKSELFQLVADRAVSLMIPENKESYSMENKSCPLPAERRWPSLSHVVTKRQTRD